MSAKSSLFESRWRRAAREVEALHGALYFSDRHAVEKVRDMLRRRFEERPDELLEMDRQRMPGWISEESCLCLRLSAKSHARLSEYAAEHARAWAGTGFSALRLPDIWEDSDLQFLKVPPECGGEDGMKKLSAVCRENGLHLGVDVEMSSTAAHHPWVREKADRMYHVWGSAELPNLYEHSLPGNRGHFVRLEDGRLYMSLGQPGTVELNYQESEVFLSVLDFLLRLANSGAEILFLHHTAFLWKVPGTSCRALPETALLLRLFRLCLQVVAPSAALTADTEEMRWAEGNADAVEGSGWVPVLWHTLATGNVRLLVHESSWRLRYPVPAVVRPLTDPEGIRWDLDYDFLSGMGWQEGPHRQYLNDYFTGRWPGSASRAELNREGRLCGNAEALCGENGKRLMLLCALLLSFGGTAVVDEELPDSVQAFLGTLRQAMGSHRAFAPRAVRQVEDTGTGDVLQIRCSCDGETVIGLFHFGPEPRVLRPGAGKTMKDLLTGETADPGNIRMEPGSFRFLYGDE